MGALAAPSRWPPSNRRLPAALAPGASGASGICWFWLGVRRRCSVRRGVVVLAPCLGDVPAGRGFGSDPIGGGRGMLDPAGSGLRWTGSGHVWRRGCSGPSLWQCAGGSAPRPVNASRRWYSHLGESSAPAGAGDGDACGRRVPLWRRRCHGECSSENLGKPMFQVLLEQVMAAHFVSHPFLKASSRFGLVRLCGGCSLWVRWWWWCGQFGVDGGVCLVGEKVVLCLRDRGSAMRRIGFDFHPKPG